MKRRLGTITLFVIIVASSLFAGKHPVPLDPKADPKTCLECHNSDNNREFGGTAPNGPHGSKNSHVLERQYVISQVNAGSGPGSPIINLNPKPVLDSSAADPYALCAKCHDLNNVNSDVSFAEHSRHIQKGMSCSACHSAHGVPAGTSGVNGQRLVNFDMNVVAPYNGVVSYNGGTSCFLTCHNHNHNGK